MFSSHSTCVVAAGELHGTSGSTEHSLITLLEMTLFLGLLSKSNIKLSCFSLVQLFVTLWTTAGQTPLSVGFSRQEYWSGLLFPPPGDLLDPGIKPSSLMSPALAGRFFATSATWEAQASHWSIVDTTQRWYYFKCVITHL